MTLDPDMSFWINTIIFNKLADICPTLSLNGEDRKVYDICIKDFRNYVSYLDRNHMKVEGKTLSQEQILSPQQEIVHDILSMMIGDTEGVPQMQSNLESTKEIAEFVDMWVHWWWGKWIQRTKVIFNQNDLPKETIKSVPFVPNIFTGEEQNELMGALIDKLIQYGEICCTQIMADALFKKAIESESGRKEWKMQDKLNLLTKLHREAKQISYTHGPLVFIRPDNYFKLREWRDDNANRII